jgi:hypothetical protein
LVILKLLKPLISKVVDHDAKRLDKFENVIIVPVSEVTSGLNNVILRKWFEESIPNKRELRDAVLEEISTKIVFSGTKVLTTDCIICWFISVQEIPISRSISIIFKDTNFIRIFNDIIRRKQNNICIGLINFFNCIERNARTYTVAIYPRFNGLYYCIRILDYKLII